jgi:hypothetical protein
MANCAFCGRGCNTLDSGGDVFILDRSISGWFQDWTKEGHKMEKVQDITDTLFFCNPEHRAHYLWGL